MDNTNIVDTNEEKINKQPAKNYKPKFKKTYLFIAIPIILVVCILATLLIVGNNTTSTDENITVISESSLKEVLEINQLDTIEYNYNAIATKYSDSGDAMYYVAYEGLVTAGIDFEQITFTVDEDNHTITITLPEVQITNVTVEASSLDYIFTNDKYETEKIYQEAYKMCKADLEKRVNESNTMKDAAKENAVSTVKALFQPWIETINNYSIVIN